MGRGRLAAGRDDSEEADGEAGRGEWQEAGWRQAKMIGKRQAGRQEEMIKKRHAGSRQRCLGRGRLGPAEMNGEETEWEAGRDDKKSKAERHAEMIHKR